MKDKDIKWEDVNSLDKVSGLFTRYCFLNSCCENCNQRVRFLCKVKNRLAEHQEKIITKLLNKRASQTKKGGNIHDNPELLKGGTE